MHRDVSRSWASASAPRHLTPWKGVWRVCVRVVRSAGARVLVLGCGTSTLPLGLAADGFAVTATDIAPAAIARMRVHAAALVGGLPCLAWPGRQPPGRAGRARPRAAAGSRGRAPSAWSRRSRACPCMLCGVPKSGHAYTTNNRRRA